MSEHRTRVWDVPTRLFHWALAALVVASVVSVKIGGNAMEWHGRFGHAILGLIVFRLVWGVIGSTYARFAHFVRGPGAVRDYLAGRWTGAGHNPLGALSVLALLGVITFQVTTGLFSNDDIAFTGPLAAAVSSDTSTWLSGWHRRMEWVIYGLVALHVVAVVFYVTVKREDIVTPMVTGYRATRVPHPPARGGGVVAFVVALLFAAGSVWATSGVFVEPPAPAPAETPAW